MSGNIHNHPDAARCRGCVPASPFAQAEPISPSEGRADTYEHEAAVTAVDDGEVWVRRSGDGYRIGVLVDSSNSVSHELTAAEALTLARGLAPPSESTAPASADADRWSTHRTTVREHYLWQVSAVRERQAVSAYLRSLPRCCASCHAVRTRLADQIERGDHLSAPFEAAVDGCKCGNCGEHEWGHDCSAGLCVCPPIEVDAYGYSARERLQERVWQAVAPVYEGRGRPCEHGDGADSTPCVSCLIDVVVDDLLGHEATAGERPCEHGYVPCPTCSRAVTPEQIVEQRAKGWPDFHPEDYCHRCGGRNVYSWHAPNEVWNQLREAELLPASDIVCPQCFTELARHQGIAPSVWHLIRGGELP